MGNVFPSFLHKACHKLTFLQNFGINNSSSILEKSYYGWNDLQNAQTFNRVIKNFFSEMKGF